MRILVILFFLFFSCQHQEKEVLSTYSNEIQTDFSSRPLAQFFREAKATLRVKEYLESNGFTLDSLYAYDISYSDTLCEVSYNSSFIPNTIEACFAIFNIEHKVNHDYYEWIENENNRIIKENEGKNEDEWEPLVIPSKPEFLKKNIVIYYYFDQDSVAITYYNLQ